MIDDIVQRTIQVGKRGKCPYNCYVSSSVMCVNGFRFEDGEGSICVGITKNSRPIDCICLCYSEHGGKLDMEVVMSPYEALKEARYLSSTVGVCALAHENNLDVSIKTVLEYGYTSGKCRRNLLCTPVLVELSEGREGYECIGLESPQHIQLCLNSDFGTDFLTAKFSLGKAQLVASILVEAVTMFMEERNNLSVIHNLQGYRSLDDTMRGD